MHTQLIAQELKSKGFDTKVSGNAVIVSLNRPISTMEVRDALFLTFDEIHFGLTKLSSNTVMVEE